MSLAAVRWDRKPSYSLAQAAQCRALGEVRPVISPWGNAMRLQIDHEIELASIHGAAWAGHDRRLAVR